MTRLERRILLAVARQTVMNEDEIVAALTDETPHRIRTFLWGMEKLGHLRQIYGQWLSGTSICAAGSTRNGFGSRPCARRQSTTDSIEQLLSIGHCPGRAGVFASEVAQLETNYAMLRELERQAGPPRRPPTCAGTGAGGALPGCRAPRPVQGCAQSAYGAMSTV
jgi:hypothetical protein